MSGYKSCVTDHALVRWLERVQGVDVDALRRQIVTPHIVAAVKVGSSRVIVDGFEYTIKNKQIVTIQPVGHKNKPKPSQFRQIDENDDD